MSQPQLDQNTIDAMFSRGAKSGEILPVDFANRASITPEQMQVLLSLNTTFSQSLGVNLSTWLGSDIKLAMMSVERCMYPSMLDMLDLPNSYFAQLRFRSPDARALVALDLALVEPVVHLGLGGAVRSVPTTPSQREPTQIDVAIMEILLETIATEMNRMWQPFNLQAGYEARVLPSSVARVFPATEYVLCFTYEIQIGEMVGTLQVALATAIASMLLRGVGGRTTDRVQPPATRHMLQTRLEGIGVRTTLRLPNFKVRASEIVNLAPGAILRSNLPRTTPAVFTLPNGPAWDAVPAVSDGRIAAKLLKLQTPRNIQG